MHENIKKAANLVLAHHPKKEKNYDWIRSVTSRLGGRIEYGEPGLKPLAVIKKDTFDIYLSCYSSPLRDTFTIGHVLGHYFVHINHSARPDETKCNCNFRGEEERIASLFGLYLLMPDEAFAAHADKEDWAVSVQFCVTEELVKQRRKLYEQNTTTDTGTPESCGTWTLADAGRS